MVLVNLMIQLVSGVVGGNAAGGAFSSRATGTLDTSVLGALGGICSAQLLGLGGLDAGSLDRSSMATQMAGSIMGGGALVLVIVIFRPRRRPGRYRAY